MNSSEKPSNTLLDNEGLSNNKKIDRQELILGFILVISVVGALLLVTAYVLSDYLQN